MPKYQGQCLCGAVKFHFSAEPVATRVCWCQDCQRLAANGTVNTIVPTDALQIDGELAEYANQAESGNQMRRRFCPRCGTQLFANSSARPQFTAVRVGTLDEPSRVPPTMNIWTRSAPSWACMDPALEQVERQPSPPAQSTTTGGR
ncbi:MAG TPA: GFA family protein [Accumulibacter sp.]|nr:GFA family protein [Accumulibacter sp.]HMW18384.1 GFA family protein [Accumulibacter sp.]HMY07650.1 GFA family protein [Accumulibacter sp.]HNC18416.1 GFA family protein [Accumulibacter sp.]HND81042.1 GFA family protein [Accumulibacter sp.]